MRYVGSGPAKGEQALVVAMAERIEEILPKGEFEVTTDGKVVNIIGIGEFRGKSNLLMPAFILRAPLSTLERLELTFKSLGERLQGFLTKAHGEPWPAVGAEPHISITDEMIMLWWGGRDEADAVVRLRPIARQDIGI